MKFKQKSWIWIFTYPFAHKNYTLILNTLFYPKGFYPTKQIIKHELIHVDQIKKYGSLKFYFLYLFAFPLFWNQFRFNVEYEAYRVGSKIGKKRTVEFIQKKYGWLINRRYTGDFSDI